MSETTPYDVRLRAGRWEIFWNEKMPTGKWNIRKKRISATNENEARLELARFTIAMAEAPKKGPKVLFDDACKAYIEDHCVQIGQERTGRQCLNAPRAALGHYAIDGIGRDAIDLFTAGRRKGRWGRGKVGDATISREITAIQAALNWYRQEVLRDDTRVSFKKPHDHNSRKDWLTEDQEDDIRAKIKDAPTDVQLIFMLGVTYGARAGAIKDLRFGHNIDFRAGVVDFRHPTKAQNRKRRPIGPMTDEVRDLLVRRMEEVGGGYVVDGDRSMKAFRAFMREIGYEWVSAHVLKHTAITLMIRGGASIESVSKATATTISTIEAHYRHHAMDEIAETLRARRRR
jgi:integrase